MGISKTRKRVAQACQRCRQRKFKCDGQRPGCSTCLQANSMCTYEPHTRRRGLPEGYVRGLELLTSLAIHYIDDFEERLLSRLLQRGRENSFQWQSNFENLLDEWRNSKLSVELEDLLPFLPSPKSNTSKRKLEDRQPPPDSPRRFWARRSTPQLPDQNNTSGQPEEEQESTHPVGTRVRSQSAEQTMLEDRSSAESTTMAPRQRQVSATTSELNMTSQLSGLIQIYFSQTHCWFPIVEKGNVMRSSYYFPDDKQENNETPGSIALIWAIAALTISQLMKSGRLAEFLGSETVPQHVVTCYYMKAREMIPSENGPFEIEHVQSLLILSLIKIDQSAWSPAWLLIGEAVRIALDLEITPRSSGGDQSFWPRRTTVLEGRTSLGCFVLDTLIAFHLCRPPHLRAEDVNPMTNADEDGLDEWDQWYDPLNTERPLQRPYFPLFTISTFNRLVKICKVLSLISTARTHGRLASHKEAMEGLQVGNKAHPLDIILREPGTSNLPEDKMLPNHYHLRLVYLVAFAELGSRSSQFVGNEGPSSPSFPISACIAEIELTIEKLKSSFDVYATAPTVSLIAAIVSKKRSTLNIGDNGIVPQMSATRELALAEGHIITGQNAESPQDMRQRTPKLGQILRPGLQEPEPGTDASPDLNPEIENFEPMVDSNSVFNEFVTIDTSEWTTTWEEGLFNLGFTANSANDFDEFCDPRS